MMKRNQIISERLRKNNGFTLIEVIAVLVVVAILAAVVVVRGISTADVNLQAEIDTLKGHLRYAQYLALNENDTDTANSPGTLVKWGIAVGNSSYELVKYIGVNKQTHTFILPNESSASHSFSHTITASSTINPILFDEWGSPGTSNINITIGGQTITDAIMANTGFIK